MTKENINCKPKQNTKTKTIISIVMMLMLFVSSALAVTTSIQEDYITVDTLNSTTINQNGNNVIDDSDINSTVQAYDSDLADLADGTLSKSKVEDSTNWDGVYNLVFANYLNWINTSVSNLTNYYLKSEVYNKTEIDSQNAVTPAINLDGSNQFTINNYKSINSVVYVSAGNSSDLMDKLVNSANGTKIIIPTGNYSIGTLQIHKRLYIEGSGDDTYISLSGIIKFYTEADYSSIKNFHLHQAGNSTAINLEGVNGMTVENIRVTSRDVTSIGDLPASEVFGIYSNSGHNNIFTANDVSGQIFDSGIRLYGNSYNELIKGNFVHDLGSNYTTGSIASGNCIEIITDETGWVDRSIITDNNLDQCGDYGLRVTNCYNCVVDGNIVFNTSRADGMWIKRTYDSVFSNNIVKNSLQDGIEGTDSTYRNLITGNYFEDIGGYAVNIDDGGIYNIVQGNYMKNISLTPSVMLNNYLSKEYLNYDFDSDTISTSEIFESDYNQDSRDSSMILGLNFEKGSRSNTTVFDSSPNNNHGTIIGNVTFDESKGVMITDGNESYVQTTASFNEATEFTVIVKAYNTPENYSKNEYLIMSADSNFRIRIFDQTRLRITTIGLTDTDWLPTTNYQGKIMEYALVFNGTNKLIYVNGEYFGTEPATGNMTALNLRVSATVTSAWTGEFYKAEAYTRALSETELKNRYYALKKPLDSFVRQKDVYVDESGLVGIGTTTPNSKLQVAGTINATGFMANGILGITDNSSYWLCTAADCSSKCQVTITDGLITGCT